MSAHVDTAGRGADPLSLAFAAMLGRQGADPFVQRMALEVAGAVAEGHSCLTFDALAGRLEARHGTAALPGGDWREILSAEEARRFVTGSATRPAPLFLDGDRLYLFRYHEAEQRVADRIRERLAVPPDYGEGAALAPYFRELFPREDDAVDWQAVAAAACVFHRFAIVTGGPGTGKTTTALRILSLLLKSNPSLRIAVAAPTGKAAARLTEAMRRRVPGCPTLDAAHALTARTLHRLLGARPGSGAYARNAAYPLAADVVLVDEASMVPLLMMEALLDALPRHARLILLGDHRQLESVETGFVLGDLCEAAGGGGKSPAFAAAYASLMQAALPEADATATPLRDAVTPLLRNRRFERQPGIATLARTIRLGFGSGTDTAGAVLDILAAGAHPDLPAGDTVSVEDFARGWIREVYADTRPGASGARAALRAINARRILAPRRGGAFGIDALNRAVERIVREERGLSVLGDYPGRPLLVTRNDYALNLFNGDVGVCWPDEEGLLRAWFEPADTGARSGAEPEADGGGTPRTFALSRLPEAATAWAMTIHRSQGSEYRDVLLVFRLEGEEPHADFFSPELFYTGATRASGTLAVLADAGAIRTAFAARAPRGSGLRHAVVAPR